MKHLNFTAIPFILAAFCACTNKGTQPAAASDSAEAGPNELLLTTGQFQKLNIHVADSMPQHIFTGQVSVAGQISCKPQSQASVTPFVGANITAILVSEGQQVKRGQILAWLSHPDLLDLQSRYLSAYNQMVYTQKDYERQQKLYAQKISSGKIFQKIQSDYHALAGEVRTLAAQLQLIGISPAVLRAGKTVSRVPLTSPISGTVDRVSAEMGQYANQQTELFHIVNLHNLYADLMIYERDLGKVKVGQTVKLAAQTATGLQYNARITSVGSTFEESPRAVHAQATIESSRSGLVNGMYMKGNILTEQHSVAALTEEGVVDETGEVFIFAGLKTSSGWAFKPIRVDRGRIENGFMEICLREPVPSGYKIATDNAYYLMSELKKSETGEDD